MASDRGTRNRLTPWARRTCRPRFGCRLCKSRLPATWDLVYDPSIGPDAATEVYNPVAPPFSPPYTTIWTPSRGLHMHYRSVLSKVRSRSVYCGPIRPAFHAFGLTVTVPRRTFYGSGERGQMHSPCSKPSDQANEVPLCVRVVEGLLGPGAPRLSHRVRAWRVRGIQKLAAAACF